MNPQETYVRILVGLVFVLILGAAIQFFLHEPAVNTSAGVSSARSTYAGNSSESAKKPNNGSFDQQEPTLVSPTSKDTATSPAPIQQPTSVPRQLKHRKHLNEDTAPTQLPDNGEIRLTPREISSDECYYSFVRDTSVYGYGSDIELERQRFVVGFAGGECGLFTNLGNVALDSVYLDSPGVKFLSQCQPGELRGFYNGSGQPLQQDGFTYSSSIPVQVGATYAERSVDPDRSDIVVAFRVIRQDVYGNIYLQWRMLRNGA